MYIILTCTSPTTVQLLSVSDETTHTDDLLITTTLYLDKRMVQVGTVWMSLFAWKMLTLPLLRKVTPNTVKFLSRLIEQVRIKPHSVQMIDTMFTNSLDKDLKRRDPLWCDELMEPVDFVMPTASVMPPPQTVRGMKRVMTDLGLVKLPRSCPRLEA